MSHASLTPTQLQRGTTMIRAFITGAVLFLSLTGLCGAVRAATGQPIDEGWPRSLVSKGVTAVVHEPQVDSWDGFNLKAHAAVSVETDEDQEPVYGMITFTARTLVDKSQRIVTFDGKGARPTFVDRLIGCGADGAGNDQEGEKTNGYRNDYPVHGAFLCVGSRGRPGTPVSYNVRPSKRFTSAGGGRITYKNYTATSRNNQNNCPDLPKSD